MSERPLNKANIESLSHDGRGVTHVNGKTIFLENALPGEEVSFVYTQRHNKFDEGRVVEILELSPYRITPKCKHFGICGGCNLQHLSHAEQIRYKIQAFQEQLQHFGGFDTVEILSPIIGPIWDYRSRARLSVKYVQKKQKVLVGFHEKNGRYVADLEECPVLYPAVGQKISPLRELITQLSIYNQIPQVEIACGENVIVLLFRHLQPLSDKDIDLLQKFGDEHNFQIYLQAGGIESVRSLVSNQTPIPLSYRHLEQNIEMLFAPTDFTQINQDVNRQMVAYILDLLEIQPGDKILDLFCGIGNFTLPLAAKCTAIVGVEGNKSAVAQAKRNAFHNRIENVEFHCVDLTKELAAFAWAQQKYDKILLDPPRTGAQEICSQLKKFGAKKIVYISCNHATFARDAKEVVKAGYQLKNAKIVDMFPHTRHMELIASFVLRQNHPLF